MIKKTFPIVGMHCASCKALIEQLVGELKGIQHVSVNYATEKMTVEYDDSQITIDKLKKTVASAGSYQLVDNTQGETVLASPPVAQKMMDHKMNEMKGMEGHDHGIPLDEKLRKKRYEELKQKVKWTGIGAIPFLIIMLSMTFGTMIGLPDMKMMLGDLTFENIGQKISLLYILQFILATPLLFVGGKEIFDSAISALKVRASNMDTLIAIGTFTAWLYSTIVTFSPFAFGSIEGGQEVYFEAAVFIIFFILLGRLLEMRAKGQATEAIKALLHLQAKDAIVIRDGQEIKIPISEVLVGDVIVVKPGIKLPVDGVVIEGASAVDESMVTGESMPVMKMQGSEVIGATINTSGFLKYKATKVGSDTMLAHIIQMVEDAQATQAPIQRLADQVAAIFVPAVIGISVLTLVFWLFIAPNIGLIQGSEAIPFALYTAITVLIIACPCALGLATPTAVMVGTGKAAQMGILVKDAKALEIAHKIDAIVFDKTGTLTKGKPEVTDVMLPKEFYAILFSIEKKSQHPLADAIVKHFQKNVQDVEIKHFEDIVGKGVKASYKGKKTLIGTQVFMTDEHILISEDIESQAQKLKKQGKTVSYIAYDGSLVGFVALADTIKDDTKSAIHKLQQMGIHTIMMTGDNTLTAKAVSNELGIDEVLAEVMPQDKSSKVKALQSDGTNRRIIAMVGDGINDAPALAQADIGIAMGTGTDVAIATGDIVLVGGSLIKVVQAIDVSRQTLQVIKQNLLWAFGYNILGIPLAAGVMYPFMSILLSPIIASLAMALSSVSVVGNSLRLKYLVK